MTQTTASLQTRLQQINEMITKFEMYEDLGVTTIPSTYDMLNRYHREAQEVIALIEKSEE